MRTDLDMLDRAIELFAGAVAFVHDDMLGAQTPCDDWDVAALLDHVTGGNRFTCNVLQGQTADAAIEAVRASFALDDDPRAAVVTSASAQRDAFAQPGVVAASFHHVAGELTGAQMLQLRIHDVNVHRWDLLQAVNPKKGLDPVYVRWAIDELARPDSLAARHMATGYRNPGKSYELLLAFGRRRSRPSEHLRTEA